MPEIGFWNLVENSLENLQENLREKCDSKKFTKNSLWLVVIGFYAMFNIFCQNFKFLVKVQVWSNDFDFDHNFYFYSEFRYFLKKICPARTKIYPNTRKCWVIDNNISFCLYFFLYFLDYHLSCARITGLLRPDRFSSRPFFAFFSFGLKCYERGV